MNHSTLYCTFHVGDDFYGVPVACVREVVPGQPLSSAPHAPAAVLGLMNLRGHIVTVIDMRRMLGLAPLPAESEPINLVLLHEGEPVGLQVDRVGDVVDVDGQPVAHAPETVRGALHDFLAGMLAMGERLMLVLDVEKMLACRACVEARPLAV